MFVCACSFGPKHLLYYTYTLLHKHWYAACTLSIAGTADINLSDLWKAVLMCDVFVTVYACVIGWYIRYVYNLVIPTRFHALYAQ